MPSGRFGLSVSVVQRDMLAFLETKLFSKLVREYLPDDEYDEYGTLQQALIAAHREPGSR